METFLIARVRLAMP